jgi:hypothetical protein
MDPLTLKEALHRVTIGIIPETEERSLITPGKPFDNQRIYLSYIESSEDFIHIVDPYFNRNSLRLFNRGIERNSSIKSVKILAKENYIDDEFRKDFKKFVVQMKHRNTTVELRVLDSKDAKKVHDRYLVTKGHSYNFVSADTVSRGQFSNVTEILDFSAHFKTLWENGVVF